MASSNILEKNRDYENIEILRCVCFLMIFSFHFGVPGTSIFWGGIEIFFIISSYFTTKKLIGMEGSQVNLKMIKVRYMRLLPCYLTLLIGTSIVSIFIHKIPYDFFAHMLYLQNFLWIATGYNSPMQFFTAHTWTLSIEMFCFIIYIFIYRFTKDRFKFALVGMLIIAFVWRIFAAMAFNNEYVVSLVPFSHIDAFAMGGLLALEENKFSKKKIVSRSLVSLIVGFFGIIAIMFVMSNIHDTDGLNSTYKLFASGVNYCLNWFTANIYFFISLISVGVVALCITLPKCKLYWLAKFGKHTYELYILHWPIRGIVYLLVEQKVLAYFLGLLSTFVVTYIFINFIKPQIVRCLKIA